jgi:spore coat protein CotH
MTFLILTAAAMLAQPQFPPPPPGGGPPPGFPPGGFGGPGGPGGRGGFNPGATTKMVKDFDKDGDGRLDAAERKAAREQIAKNPRRGFGGPGGRGGPRGGGPFGRGGDETPPQPGPKLTPDQVKTYGDEPLYDGSVLRTLFLEFENPDWEAELADFNNTDVEVPVTLRADGKTYKGVGVHFRGMSSFMMVPAGRKRSLNISMDFINKDQRLNGYRTLNLLNSHGDPTLLRTVLYLDIARSFIPAPKANYMRVVINGESWGIYVNQQQFNTDFVKEWFKGANGARWKVSGSPMGQGGLSYLGEDPAPYKKIYDIKSKDNPKDWAALINLTKVLTETPIDQLEKAAAPILDIDGALKFLALEKALVNSDGYWIRASDYTIYLDAKGVFHVIPHDSNETIRPPEGGPGMRGMNAGKGTDLDPFAGSQDSKKVLISRLLAVPSLRAKYLGYMKQIAETWMTWNKLGPMAERYQSLIAADVKTDTRKLDSTAAFTDGVTVDREEEQGWGRPGGAPAMSLKTFVEERRKFLLSYSSK